jgi:hypothetical protein
MSRFGPSRFTALQQFVPSGQVSSSQPRKQLLAKACPPSTAADFSGAPAVVLARMTLAFAAI